MVNERTYFALNLTLIVHFPKLTRADHLELPYSPSLVASRPGRRRNRRSACATFSFVLSQAGRLASSPQSQ